MTLPPLAFSGSYEKEEQQKRKCQYFNICVPHLTADLANAKMPAVRKLGKVAVIRALSTAGNGKEDEAAS